MAEAKIICDTDVMIDYFDELKPRHAQTKRIIEQEIDLDNVLLSVITKMELISGATNKTELNLLTKKLKRFGVILLDSSITELSLNLLMTYKLSHNLAIPDCLIAGTTLQTNLELFTYNTKDFKFIPKLKLYKPSL